MQQKTSVNEFKKLGVLAIPQFPIRNFRIVSCFFFYLWLNSEVFIELKINYCAYVGVFSSPIAIMLLRSPTDPLLFFLL